MSSRTVPENATLSAQVSIPRHVVYRAFPSETVVLNLQTGTYHGLNPTGGRMLEELERAPTVAEAVPALADAYEVDVATIERDLCELCEALHSRGLIEVDVLPAS